MRIFLASRLSYKQDCIRSAGVAHGRSPRAAPPRKHDSNANRSRSEVFRTGPGAVWSCPPVPSSRRLPMNLSTPKHPFTLQAVLATVGLLASLCVGACSRSTHVTDSLVGPTLEGNLGFAAIGKGHHQPLPETPTLSAPTDGATDVAVAATLSWN